MKKQNHYRQTLNDYHLLEYFDCTNTSERNRTIILQYAQGKSQSELAKEFEIGTSRVHGIISFYISNVEKYLHDIGVLTSYNFEKSAEEFEQLKTHVFIEKK